MANPSEMTDEELNQVIETGIEPEEPTVPEPTEEEVAEPTEPVEDETPEEAPQEEATIEEPAQPSRREQLRIQQLLKKYGPPPTTQPVAPSERLDYSTALDADPEVIQQLEEDRRREAQAQYAQGQSEGLKQMESLKWNTSLQIDAPNVEKKYPILDPQSSEFHPAVADSINQWYLNMSGFDPQTQFVSNPNIKYGDFIEGFMELVQETAGQKTAQTAKNIAKQAATTGLRPDGSSAKALNLNQSEKTMSLEELYAAIGQKPPQK